MNELKQFINNLFYALPKTDEVLEIKDNITQNMAEKYESLIEEGKSHQEAYYVVTTEFGDMKELCDEFSIPFEAISIETRQDLETAKFVAEYQVFRKKYELGMLKGIGIIFIGAILFILTLALGGQENPISVTLNDSGFGVIVRHVEGIAFTFLVLGFIIGFGYIIKWELKNDTYKERRKLLKKGKGLRADQLSTIVMCVAAILFFIMLVFFDGGSYAFIFLIIGGLICGIINAVV